MLLVRWHYLCGVGGLVQQRDLDLVSALCVYGMAGVYRTKRF